MYQWFQPSRPNSIIEPKIILHEPCLYTKQQYRIENLILRATWLDICGPWMLFVESDIRFYVAVLYRKKSWNRILCAFEPG